MKTTKLSAIAEIIMGQSPPGESYNESKKGLPFFQGKAEFGEISPVARKWCDSPKKIAEAGDILMSVRAPVGPTNIASERCCIGRGLAAIRANEGIISSDYLHFFLRHKESYLASMGQGSTFAAIGKTEISNLDILVPAIQNQRRLVDILTRAESIVRLRREALKKTQEIIPALFVDMFGDPATNPKGWPINTFGNFGDCRLGKMLDKKKQSGEYKHSYLRNVNVQWDRISTDDLLEMDFHPEEQETFRLKKGDILICEGGEVGRAAIWDGSVQECFYQKALHRLRPDKTKTNADFIVWLLWQLARSGALIAAGTQSTIAHLTGVQLKGLRVIYPPINLQEQFSEHTNQVRSIQSQATRALATAEATFQSLLHRAFAGEL